MLSTGKLCNFISVHSKILEIIKQEKQLYNYKTATELKKHLKN